MTSNSALHNVLILLFATSLFTAHVVASNSRPPRNNEISNMADALKYLQDLDSYYGDRSRVRFGKRNPLAELWRNHFADSSNVHHAIETPPAEELF